MHFKRNKGKYNDTIPENCCRMHLQSIVDFVEKRFRDKSGYGFD